MRCSVSHIYPVLLFHPSHVFYVSQQSSRQLKFSTAQLREATIRAHRSVTRAFGIQFQKTVKLY